MLALASLACMSSETTSRTSELSVQATDKLVDLVDKVRVNTTGRLITVARAIVYGLVILVVAIVALVLLVVGLVRLVDVLVPGQVWSAHLLLGVLFCIVGMVLWRMRTP